MNAFAFCFGFHQAAFLTVQRLAIVPVRTHRICSTELPNYYYFFFFLCKSRSILYANLTQNWKELHETPSTAHGRAQLRV